MLDIADLYHFYTTPLGRSVAALLQQRVRAVWPELPNQRVCGFGYAVPLLDLYPGSAALMPAAQGVMAWPRGNAPRALLVDEYRWPLADSSIDALILMHALEHAEQTRRLLREAWRVLRGDGRLLVIVPNRLSIWARREVSPFGYGKPYTLMQVKTLLQQSMLTPLQHRTALLWPPCRQETLLKAAPYADAFLGGIASGLGGALIVEAGKQVYAPTFHSGTAVRIKGTVPVMKPALSPDAPRLKPLECLSGIAKLVC
ncbi:MAG: methyltransferase domain-containing protein [Thalassospira sp.]|nr:methyltransferase domain-containing protein [Thalassospira sp.]